MRQRCGSLITYIALRMTVGTAPFVVLIVCAFLAMTFAVWLPRRDEALLPLPAITRRDGFALTTLLLAVALIVGPVFANVGRQTPQGLAYRAYFNADLLLASASSRRGRTASRGLVDGLLLGGALVCSSFNGLPLVAAYALAEVIALARARFADAARGWPRLAALALTGTIVVGTGLAVPTVALDWYNARDISNLDMSPGGFPWTVYISPANQAALAWIETMLPENAMVQMIYRTPDPRLAYGYCESLGIEYLYVGPEERAADGPNVDKFAHDPDRFVRIYNADGVAIYRVQGMTARLNHHWGTR